VRDALYDDLPTSRRLALHRAIAEALEERYADDLEPHVAELAHHYLEGGPEAADRALDYARRAGERAAAQLGYEEAARHYASALRVLETTAPGESEAACALLVALGEALSRGGSQSEAKGALRRAADLADRAGRPDLLARAALGYGSRFAWARASTDPHLVPLLERALEAIGSDDSPERARLLARLAGASRDDWDHERRARLGDEAVAIARRLGDPMTLAFALEGHFVAVEGPNSAGFGLDLGEQLVALGRETGDRERVFAGHDHRFHTFWQLADRAGVEAELYNLSRLADELRQPAQRWHVGTGETMLALLDGRFDDAERLIAETRDQGRRAESWNAVVTERLATFVLRREQGRLAEVEDTIRRSVAEYPALLRFRCAHAHLLGELGRERETRAALDELTANDLAREHVDAEWVFSISLLCDPCAAISAIAAAEKLHAVLVPHEHLYAQAPVEAAFGSAARALGVFATVLRRFDDAEGHFERALEIESRMRSRPGLAHVRHDLAAMLLARGEAGDGERARELLAEATATYRELGMESWAARAAALAG
jgi:tetratricopeptide (TPR) repeat protein